MKRPAITFFISIFIFPLFLNAQDANPQLLDIPEDWRFEFIGFPLDFAPSLEYEGFEELRFAPGMFDSESNTYFTYLFAMALEGKIEFDIPKSKQFLTTYFQGLSYNVAKSKEASVDTSKIQLIIQRPDIKMGKHEGYFITVNYIDSFNNMNEITINMELVVLYPKSGDKTYLVALASPQPKYSEVWKELYEYRKTLMTENPVFKELRSK